MAKTAPTTAPTPTPNQKTSAQLAALCQPADIILSRSPTGFSKAIQVGSCSVFSHAILALDDGQCIESLTNGGVSDPKSLNEALKTCSYARLYRYKSISDSKATWVCYYAKEQAGKSYDVLGAARSGAQTGCNPTRRTPLGIAVIIYDALTKKNQAGHDETFFCSELIARAFEKAWVPLFDNLPAHAITPGLIVESKKLRYIETLVEETT